MAEAIERETGHWPQLVRATGGIFEVRVDNKVVAKKTWMGFPTEEEILREVLVALETAAPTHN